MLIAPRESEDEAEMDALHSMDLPRFISMNIGDLDLHILRDPEEKLTVFSTPADEDVEPEEPVPSLEEEAKEGKKGCLTKMIQKLRLCTLGGMLRLGAPAAGLLLASCAHVQNGIEQVQDDSRELASSAFYAGKYGDGIRQLKKIPESQRTDKDKEMLVKMERMNEKKFKILLEETRKAEGQGGMKNNYVAAVKLYELMWECLEHLEDHPYHKNVKIRLGDLRKLVTDAQKELDEAKAAMSELEGQLSDPKNPPKFALLVYKKQKAGAKLGLDVNPELARLCLKMAREFQKQGHDKEAALYFGMVEELMDLKAGGLLPDKQSMETHGVYAAVEGERYRLATLEELNGFVDEFVALMKVKRRGRGGTRRLIQLAYEIAESTLVDEIEDEAVVTEAGDIKKKDERQLSVWRREQLRKKRDRERKARENARKQEAENKKKALAKKAGVVSRESSKPQRKAKKELTEAQTIQLEKLLGNADNLFPSEASLKIWNKVLSMYPDNEEAKAGKERYEEYLRIKKAKNGNGH